MINCQKLQQTLNVTLLAFHPIMTIFINDWAKSRRSGYFYIFLLFLALSSCQSHIFIILAKRMHKNYSQDLKYKILPMTKRKTNQTILRRRKNVIGWIDMWIMSIWIVVVVAFFWETHQKNETRCWLTFSNRNEIFNQNHMIRSINVNYIMHRPSLVDCHAWNEHGLFTFEHTTLYHSIKNFRGAIKA